MKKKRYLPFGYQMEKGEIIPHPDEGPLVQAIFSKYLERTALSTLAKYASLSGIPYREGAGQWNKAMVCRILDNSKYAGDEGFPPLISKEQLEEAAFLRAAKAKQWGRRPACGNEKNPPADLLRKLWANPQASQYADRIHLVGMPKMRDKHRLHTRRTIAAKRDCPIKPGN